MKGWRNEALLLCRVHSDIALDAVLLAVPISEPLKYAILLADRHWNDPFHCFV